MTYIQTEVSISLSVKSKRLLANYILKSSNLFVNNILDIFINIKYHRLK